MNDGDGAARATVVAADVYRVAADDDSCCAVVYDDDLSTGDPSVRAAVQPAARSWSPTVRPPRLGDAQRVGVFATRSPFRPNPIGLTCVKIDRVELTDAGPIIHVLGADLRNGTPIFDIKPYILFADCHPDATGCFIDAVPWRELDVNFPESLQAQVPPAKLLGLIEVLRQDPRRAGSEHEPAGCTIWPMPAWMWHSR